MPNSRFFQAGGSLPSNMPSYITRQADEDLYQYLNKGEFCYVLTARQMGKSSLKVRTMKRLEQEGWHVVNVDLTGLGTQDIPTEKWYYTFLHEVADTLDLEDLFNTWWQEKSQFTAVARMTNFWEEIIVSQIDQKIGIFIDEVDTLLSLNKTAFSASDFFAAIRSIYNKRSLDDRFQQLNFCIFGVAAPQDLMNDPDRTPFNIGKSIILNNFSPRESAPLFKGLNADAESARNFIDRIHYWVEGQPYLTQKLCQLLTVHELETKDAQVAVDELVKQHFLETNVLNSDPHFSNIQNRIFSDELFNLRMLGLYRRLLQGEEVSVINQNIEQLYLKLSGLVKEEGSILKITNAIYVEIFNQNWLNDAYDSVDRPFAIDLKRWINSNHSKDALLVGSILADAETWAKNREDLSNEERDFLQESRLLEEENLRLKERVKQRKRLIWALGVATILAIATSITTYWGFSQASIAKEQEGLAKKNEKKALENEALAKARADTARAATTLALNLRNISDSLRLEAEEQLMEIRRQEGIISAEKAGRETEQRKVISNRISRILEFWNSGDYIGAKSLLAIALRNYPNDPELLKLKEELENN